MLLFYCKAEQERRGRQLTVRQMEKEAMVWEREGILDHESAVMYIGKKERSRESTSRVYGKLGIFGREPSATEKKYVASWLELGFTVEAIALAYDKTIINTGKLAWGYCDKILQRWHEKGWHTPAQIETYDKKTPPVNNGGATGSYSRTKEALRRVKGETGNDG
jgi:DnaD/phage-associated family protein